MPITLTQKAPPPPIPSSGAVRYPFLECPVGGMFFVPLFDSGMEDLGDLLKRVRGAAGSRKSRYPGEDYTVAEWAEDGQSGIGVWKTAG